MFGTPKLSMFPTFMMADKMRKESPAIFVDNRREKVVKQEMKITDHTQFYFELQRNPYTIVELIKEQVNIIKVDLRTISLVDRRELSVFLLNDMADQPESGWEDVIPSILDRIEYEEYAE